MKVFDGHRTVSPGRRRTRSRRRARRPPSWRGRRCRVCSKPPSAPRTPCSLAPSDHCSESRTSVQSSKRRGRSRWSKPIANLVTSGREYLGGAYGGAPSGECCWEKGLGGSRDQLIAEGGARLAAKSERRFKSADSLLPPEQEAVSASCAASISSAWADSISGTNRGRAGPGRSGPPMAGATSAAPPACPTRTLRRSAAPGSPARRPGRRTSQASPGSAGHGRARSSR